VVGWLMALAACRPDCGTEYLGGGRVELETALPGAVTTWRVAGATADEFEGWRGSGFGGTMTGSDGPGDDGDWAFGEQHLGADADPGADRVLAHAGLAGVVSPCHPDGALLELSLDLDTRSLALSVEVPYALAFRGHLEDVAVDGPLRGSVVAVGRWESEVCGLSLDDTVTIGWAFDEEEVYWWEGGCGDIVQL
jgi:hypothetical protein